MTFLAERTYMGIYALCTVTPISVIVAAYLYTRQVKETWGAISGWSGSGSKGITLSLKIKVRQVNIVLPPFSSGICLFSSILMVIGHDRLVFIHLCIIAKVHVLLKVC